MSLRPKILGISVTALLCLCAAATSVQAATPEAHCTTALESCIIASFGGTHETGSNDNAFVFAGGAYAVECKGSKSVDGAQFAGTTPKTTSALTLEPTYTGCQTVGMTFSVKTEGCSYRLQLVAGSSPATAKADVICPTGKAITIADLFSNCVTTIGAQTGVSHVVLKNSESSEPTHVLAEFTLEGLSYTATGSECPKAGNFNDGKYTGTATLAGFEDSKGVKGAKVGFHVF